MTETKKTSKTLQIFLCVALLASVALNVFLFVQKGDLTAAKNAAVDLHADVVKAKDALIAEKEKVETELNEVKLKVENAAADLLESTGREDALKTEVASLKADAEKAAKELATALEEHELTKDLKKGLEDKLAELNTQIKDLETKLGEALEKKEEAVTPAN